MPWEYHAKSSTIDIVQNIFQLLFSNGLWRPWLFKKKKKEGRNGGQYGYYFRTASVKDSKIYLYS